MYGMRNYSTYYRSRFESESFLLLYLRTYLLPITICHSLTGTVFKELSADGQTFMDICSIIAENGTAEQSMTWAPFGYTMVTFGDEGKAKQAAPAIPSA